MLTSSTSNTSNEPGGIVGGESRSYASFGGIHSWYFAPGFIRTSASCQPGMTPFTGNFAGPLDQSHDLGLIFLRHLRLAGERVTDALSDLLDRDPGGADFGTPQVFTYRDADGVATLTFR